MALMSIVCGCADVQEMVAEAVGSGEVEKVLELTGPVGNVAVPVPAGPWPFSSKREESGSFH